MPNQSIFGSVYTLKASVTFPVGILLTSFPDDTDPFDVPDLQVGDTAMGPNGDLATWSTAKAIEVVLALMANSFDHDAMNTLLEANRPEKGKLHINDVITVTRVDPDGRTITFNGGKLVSGTPMSSFSSVGRVKNPSYTLHFAGTSSTPGVIGAVGALAGVIV